MKQYLANFQLVREKLNQVEEQDRHLRNWQPPVSGEDIMKYFGIGPLPQSGNN